eukprot:scaffold113112_cov62-Phaeocystis_antarctica.AAC.1
MTFACRAAACRVAACRVAVEVFRGAAAACRAIARRPVVGSTRKRIERGVLVRVEEREVQRRRGRANRQLEAASALAVPAWVVDVHNHACLRDGALEDEQRVHIVFVPAAEVHARQPVALEHLDAQLAERIVRQEEAWLRHLHGRHQVGRAAARVVDILGPACLGREPPPLLSRCFNDRCELVPGDPGAPLIGGTGRDELPAFWDWRRHGSDGSVDHRAPHPGVVSVGLLHHRG